MRRDERFPEQAKRWLDRVMLVREVLIEIGKVMQVNIPKNVLHWLYVYGLDGDDPEEFPELTKAFFKGAADLAAIGQRVLDRYMRNGR